MKSRKKVLVAVSALALRGFFTPGSAFAQVQIDCTVPVRLGHHAECGAPGQYEIRPNGTDNVKNGCLIVVTAAQPGQCFLFTGGVAPTKSVRVSFPDDIITMVGGGGGNAVVRTWRLSEDGTNMNLTKATFSPTEVVNGVVLDIGVHMQFSGNQPLGNYIGQNTITATELP